jgi:hypothetical protein
VVKTLQGKPAGLTVSEAARHPRRRAARIRRPPARPLPFVIADRLGQYYSNRKASAALFHQAALAYRLATELDAAYLDHRIREETALELDLSAFERLVANDHT